MNLSSSGLGSKRLVYVVAGVFAFSWLHSLWTTGKAPEYSWAQIAYQLGFLVVLVGGTFAKEP